MHAILCCVQKLFLRIEVPGYGVSAFVFWGLFFHNNLQDNFNEQK